MRLATTVVLALALAATLAVAAPMGKKKNEKEEGKEVEEEPSKEPKGVRRPLDSSQSSSSQSSSSTKSSRPLRRATVHPLAYESTLETTPTATQEVLKRNAREVERSDSFFKKASKGFSSLFRTSNTKLDAKANRQNTAGPMLVSFVMDDVKFDRLISVTAAVLLNNRVDTEGVFREVGSASQVKAVRTFLIDNVNNLNEAKYYDSDHAVDALRDLYNANLPATVSSSDEKYRFRMMLTNNNVMTSVMKNFVKGTFELLPSAVWDQLNALASGGPNANAASVEDILVRGLTPDVFHALVVILHTLNAVTQHVATNKMDLTNVCIASRAFFDKPGNENPQNVDSPRLICELLVNAFTQNDAFTIHAPFSLLPVRLQQPQLAPAESAAPAKSAAPATTTSTGNEKKEKEEKTEEKTKKTKSTGGVKSRRRLSMPATQLRFGSTTTSPNQ